MVDYSTQTDENGEVGVGRPRLLSRGEILDAAIRLGLENLTMRALSQHLNVGTATLYQYFSSREELLSEAAMRALRDVPLPDDTGQDWPSYAREYAHTLRQLLADNPYYLMNYQQSDYGLGVQFQLAEKFLAAMEKRDFEVADAVTLFNAVGMAAVAGAIETQRQDAFARRNTSFKAQVSAQMKELDSAEMKLLRKGIGEYTSSAKTRTDDLLNMVFQAVSIKHSDGGRTRTIFSTKSEV